MGDGGRNVCRIRYLDLHGDIDLYDVLGGPTMRYYWRQCPFCKRRLEIEIDMIGDGEILDVELKDGE